MASNEQSAEPPARPVTPRTQIDAAKVGAGDFWGTLPASLLGYAHLIGEVALPLVPAQFTVRRCWGANG